MNNAELLELYSKVAQHLSGVRSVKVRLKEPVAFYATGQVYKSRTGVAVLDISPYLLSLDEQYEVFCHEVAHLFYDFSSMPAGDFHLRAEGSVVQADAEREQWRSSLPEKRAHVLGTVWCEYGRNNAWRHIDYNEVKLIWCLRALLDWKKSDLLPFRRKGNVK